MDGVDRRPRVYLGGPAVFEPEPDGIFAAMKQSCACHGRQGVSPFDNQAGLESVVPGRDLAHRVVQADIALMRTVKRGVFRLDSFRRGAEMDAGTAFEIGFMHALGKPMVGWTRDARSYPDKVRAFFAITFGLDLVADAMPGAGGRSGSLRDHDGILVHSEGCLQNAMVPAAIEMTGGTVCADADWRRVFDRAAERLAALLGAASPV